MLTRKMFDYGMTLLEQNYDRKLTELIGQLWFRYLDEHLSDDEFLAAVKHAILHNRFMPTASELVEHIHGGKEAKAIQEWQEILKASSRVNAKEQLTYLSDRARIALHAVGGIHAAAVADDYERRRLEKSFVTVYCQCSSKDSRALPPTSSEVATEANREPATPSPMPEYVREQLRGLGAKFAMATASKEVDDASDF